MSDTINSKILHATKWSGLTELLSKIITPLINLVLARLLSPEVFGVVATFTLVITFAEVFTDAGFQKYLVQHKFKDDDDKIKATNVAFWTNLVFSCLVWLIIFLFRNQIAKLVGSEGYGFEIAIMSLNIPMVAFSSIQTAIYRREFKFKQLLPIRIITCAIPLIVTLPLAAVYRNCWAIIIGNLAKEAVFATLLTIRSEWKPKLYYSFSKLKDMLSFSLTMMADSFMIWFTSYCGTLIVSRFLNDYYTGIYKTGITTISTYMNLIYTITAPVFFSAMSRMQEDRTQCDELYYSFQRYCSLFVIPLGFGVFVYRDFATQILLGSQWGESSLILGGTALAMSYAIVTAQFNSDYFRSQGKPKVALLVQSLYAAIMIASLPFAVRSSFTTLSIVRPCLNIAYSIISTAVICIKFKVSFKRIAENLIPPTLAACVMSLAAVGLKQLGNSFVWNLVSVIMCMLVYLAVVLIFPPTRKEIMSIEIVKKIKAKISR